MSSRKKVRTQSEEKKTYHFEEKTRNGVIKWDLDSNETYANGTRTIIKHNIIYQYIGKFKNRKPHGVGVEKMNDLVVYDGEWKNGKEHGYGVLFDSDGERYRGEYKNGEFHGHGEYRLHENTVIRGEFENGEIIGDATQETPFGEYTGQFNDYFARNGRGEMRYRNGDVYTGYWKEDLPHGPGVHYSKIKNQTVSGNWIHGKRHGDFLDLESKERYSYYLGEEKKFRELNDAKRCPNESAISLTAYDDDDAKAEYPDDLIYLLLGNRYYCVLRSELKDTMDKQERVYAWIPRQPYPEGCCAYQFLPRFKILEFGWFDTQTYTNLMNPEFNKFRIVELGLQPIGSAFGHMGALHNAEEQIRQAVPVRNVNDRAVPIPEQAVFFQSEKYTDEFFDDERNAYEVELEEEENVYNDDYPIPIKNPEEVLAEFKQAKGIR